jgi:hypothetical protein
MEIKSRKTILKGVQLVFLLSVLLGCRSENEKWVYGVSERAIKVDADTSDWDGVPAEVVNRKSHLWIGQGMTSQNWLGTQDLSFQWRAARNGNKLYFLYEVTDDRISPFDRENTWLNDCLELCIDPGHKGGLRKETVGGKVVLHGYETHFSPSQPPHAYLYDTSSVFFTASPQDSIFENEWNGEMAVKYMSGGYIMELSFSIPGLTLTKGTVIGFETGISDDDGNSRKNLMIWTGIQTDFWITMDKYGQLVIQ